MIIANGPFSGGGVGLSKLDLTKIKAKVLDLQIQNITLNP